MFLDKNFINEKSPREKNDHPEHDNSELYNEEQITKYMYMVGQLQWAITLAGMTTWRMSCQCPNSD